jgi:hypothetical protein
VQGVKTRDQAFAMYLFLNNAPLKHAKGLSQRFAPRGVTDLCDKVNSPAVFTPYSLRTVIEYSACGTAGE